MHCPKLPGPARRDGLDDFATAHRPIRYSAYERGERNARSLGERLHGMLFATVFTSTLKRGEADRGVGGVRGCCHC